MKPFLENLVRDLVEKRLWPVAAILVVAMVAVPVVLMRGGQDASAPVAPQGGAAGAAGQDAQVRLDTSAPAARATSSVTRNPFAGGSSGATAASGTTTTASTASSAQTTTTSGTTAASTSAGTPTPVASGTGTSSSAGTSSSPSALIPVTPSPSSSSTSPSSTTPSSSTSGGGGSTGSSTSSTPQAAVVHKVTLRFGPTDAKRRTMRDVARLTALPNAKSPVAMLLGVRKDRRTVVFVVGDKVVASGNGACKPSVTDCRTVEMKADDAQYFHVPASGSQPDRWYYLKVLHVDRRATSASAARAAAARRSTPGMAAVRKAAKKVAGYRYLPALGVLVRAKRAASGSSAVAARAARARSAVRQPGVPAWRSAAPAASR